MEKTHKSQSSALRLVGTLVATIGVIFGFFTMITGFSDWSNIFLGIGCMIGSFLTYVMFSAFAEILELLTDIRNSIVNNPKNEE